MKDLPETTRDKLEKIARLSEQGVDGEQTAAKELLKKLCEKHGVDPESLLEEESFWFTYRYKDSTDRILLDQCVCKACGTSHIQNIPNTSDKTITFKLTAEQKIDVDLCYAHYRKLWLASIKDFMTAFIHSNQIYSPFTNDADDDEEEIPESTPAEKERNWRIANMMQGIRQDPWKKTHLIETES